MHPNYGKRKLCKISLLKFQLEQIPGCVFSSAKIVQNAFLPDALINKFKLITKIQN